MKHVYIIAEIGCNHNGDVELAEKMVNEAKKCGVDAVKFQTFNAKSLISKYAPKADYQIATTGNNDSQLEMTQKLELKLDEYIHLKKLAESLGLEVFSTPFDMRAIDDLTSLNQKIWKIPSGEITNLPYLEKINTIKCEDKVILLSTGMSTIDEIKRAVNVLQRSEIPSRIIILHCNTEYPTPDEDVNITAIMDLKRNFPSLEVGYSDHSVGAVAATVAVGMDIALVEKHFTLDKNFPGPDHKASATPEELTELCQSIRRAEVMLGDNKKIVSPSEEKNKIVARKSIVANCDIKKGDIYSEGNLTCKRPGNGISPMNWYDLIGKQAERDFKEDELIAHSGFENQL